MAKSSSGSSSRRSRTASGFDAATGERTMAAGATVVPGQQLDGRLDLVCGQGMGPAERVSDLLGVAVVNAPERAAWLATGARDRLLGTETESVARPGAAGSRSDRSRQRSGAGRGVVFGRVGELPRPAMEASLQRADVAQVQPASDGEGPSGQRTVRPSSKPYRPPPLLAQRAPESVRPPAISPTRAAPTSSSSLVARFSNGATGVKSSS